MSEPTFTVELNREQVRNILKDAQARRFPDLETHLYTDRFFSEMRSWWIANRPESTKTYSAEVRPFGVGVWEETGSGTDAPTVAHSLDRAMQEHGLRFSELHAHREDLVSGHMLTADDGTEFRIVPQAAQ
jgi:hypothetical protein